MMIGGAAPRISHGDEPHPSRSMRLRHQLANDDGFLFQLWERAAPRTGSAND